MLRTANYNLCQYEGSDKTSYLVNYNDDMLKIDTAIKAASDAADTASTKADTADGKADTNASNISTLNTQINGSGGIATDVATLQGNVNSINSLIGNGTPTTTDKTLIGAINELDSDIDEVAGNIPTSASALAYDNTQSGLSATNVQGAIDELASEESGVITLASVTADGVKTANTLLGELFTALSPNISKVNAFTKIKFGDDVYTVSSYTASEVFASRDLIVYRNDLSKYVFYHRQVELAATSSWSEMLMNEDDTITHGDRNSSVPANGTVISVLAI